MKTKRRIAFIIAVLLALSSSWNLTIQANAEETEAIYEYSYPCTWPGENQMLVGESIWIDKNMSVYYEDSDAPDGANADTTITNLELKQYTWDESGKDIEADDTIFEVYEDEYGWDIRGVDHGWAEVTITYDTLENDKRPNEENEEVNEATYTFEVYSIGQYYRLDLFYPNDTAQMLQNSTMTVDTNVTRRYLDENNNHCEEVVEDYELHLSQYKDEDGNMQDDYDTDLVSIEIEDKAFSVTSKDNCWGMGTYVYASIPNGKDEEGNTTYDEAGNILESYVNEEYTNIEPTYLENILVGETLNLAAMDEDQQPKYYRYYKDKDGNEQRDLIEMDNETIRMRMEYNEDVFEATEETGDDLIPVLVRKSQDGGHIRLIVEECSEENEEWYEVNSRHYNMDWVDYSTWFADLQGDGYGWIYTNQTEQVYHLDTSILDEKSGYEVIFEFGKWVDMENHEDGGEYVPYESEEHDTQEGWLFDYVKTDGKVTGVKLHVEEIGAFQNLETGDTWSQMKVLVRVGNQIVHEESNGLDYRFGGCEYDLPEEEWILPYWGYGIDKELSGRQYGPECPEEGEDFTTTVTDVSINVIEGDKYDFSVNEWEDGNGWNIDAEDFGRAEVTITYIDASDGESELKHTFTLGVGGEIWEMDDLIAEDGSDQMVPGGTKTLKTAVRIKKYDTEKGHYTEIPNIEYVWEEQENDIVELTVNEGDPSQCEVVAQEEVENGQGTRIVCTVYLLDEDGKRQVDDEGNDIIYGERDFWLSVYDSFYYIDCDADSDFEVGQEITITPTLKNVSMEDAIENAIIEADWDSNAISVTDAEGNSVEMGENGRAMLTSGETYTLKRMGDWQTHFNMWGFAPSEDDGVEEMAYRGIRFAELNYDISYDDLREEGFTRIFSEEEDYTITLNTSNIADESTDNGLREGLTIQWRLGYWGEDGFEPIDLQEGIMIVGEGSECNHVTLNGILLKNQLPEEEQGGIHLQAVILSNETEVRENSIWIEVREEEEYLEDDEICETIIGPAWVYDNNTITYAVLDQNHPSGAEFEATIESITCDTTGEDAIFEVYQEDGTWIINALKEGNDNITFKITYEDSGETITKDVTRTRYVNDVKYYFNVFSDTSTEHMVPGQTMTLSRELYKITYNAEEDSRDVVPVSEDEYDLSYYDYDGDVVKVSEDGTITALNRGETSIRVVAHFGEIELETYVYVYVVKAYAKMVSEVVWVGPGAEFTLEATNAKFMTYDRGDLEGTEVEADSLELAEQELDSCFTVNLDGKITVNEDFEAEEWPYETGFEVNGTLGEDTHSHWCKVIICKHSWKDGDVIKEATCEAAGTKELVCEHCDGVSEVEIPKLAHTEVEIPAVAATETSTGLTAGKKCSVCGTITVAQKITEKLPPTTEAPSTTTEAPTTEAPSTTTEAPATEAPPTTTEHTHKYTYVSNNNATVLADGTKTGTCSCGTEPVTVTDVGSKLKATIKVPATKFSMKVKQTYKGFVVTMGKGDYITSVKSNKTSIVKISGISKKKGTFTIKAQKKTGKAVVTIKLASGKTKKLTITVQKKAVKTTKISGLKNITLKKGKKTTLAPEITPITSTQKVKYTSSNKKVVTVTAKGVVTAKKRGTAKITVTSGSKKKTIKVTVKNK